MRRTPKLGQHLLTNPFVAGTVADAAGVEKGTLVLEVGPGKGALTGVLLARGARVIAVEKDPKMIEALHSAYSKEIASKQLTIVPGDMRDTPPDTLMPRGDYVVAANIPYYITGELLRTFLTATHQPRAVSLLVQKEVAERVARDKKESILSLSVKAYGTPRYVQTVKRGNFAPPPKVDSAVLAITDISRKNFKTVSEENFFNVVKAGFAQKRKTLAGNFMRTFGDTLGAPEKVRAEDVTLSAWLAFAKRLER